MVSMKEQMLGMFPHISKQTVGQYERETGTVTMFYLLPAKAKVIMCIELLKETDQPQKAIDIIDYLRTLSEQRTDYAAWGKDKELVKAYTNAKYRVGIVRPAKFVTRKTV